MGMEGEGNWDGEERGGKGREGEGKARQGLEHFLTLLYI